MIKTNEPVAWAVTPRGNNEEIDCEFIYPDPATAGDVALGALDGESDAVVVPLYLQPQPTLTDDDLQALDFMLRHAAWAAANGAFADSSDYRIHHDTVFRIAGRRYAHAGSGAARRRP